MERLTCRDKEITLPSPDNAQFWARVHEKLAQYEDTNFSPDEISCINRGDIDCDSDQLCACMGIVSARVKRLEKYQKAEKDGRMFIMPCKVGDTVYAIVKDKVLAVYVVSIARHEWQPCWIVNLLFDHRKTNGVYAYSIDRFGRDVFLTREEAEAALKGATS